MTTQIAEEDKEKVALQLLNLFLQDVENFMNYASIYMIKVEEAEGKTQEELELDVELVEQIKSYATALRQLAFRVYVRYVAIAKVMKKEADSIINLYKKIIKTSHPERKDVEDFAIELNRLLTDVAFSSLINSVLGDYYGSPA